MRIFKCLFGVRNVVKPGVWYITYSITGLLILHNKVGLRTTCAGSNDILRKKSRQWRLTTTPLFMRPTELLSIVSREPACAGRSMVPHTGPTRTSRILINCWPRLLYVEGYMVGRGRYRIHILIEMPRSRACSSRYCGLWPCFAG